MDCSCLSGVLGPRRSPLVSVQSSEDAGVDAACKLIGNFARVVKDITNSGPCGLGGGDLTQKYLERVDPQHTMYVEAMVRAACCRLLGKEMRGPSTPEEALVWAKAARFLNGRIQGSPNECGGREADMSPGQ